jgi:hypothetical protein
MQRGEARIGEKGVTFVHCRSGAWGPALQLLPCAGSYDEAADPTTEAQYLGRLPSTLAHSQLRRARGSCRRWPRHEHRPRMVPAMGWHACLPAAPTGTRQTPCVESSTGGPSPTTTHPSCKLRVACHPLHRPAPCRSARNRTPRVHPNNAPVWPPRTGRQTEAHQETNRSGA